MLRNRKIMVRVFDLLLSVIILLNSVGYHGLPCARGTKNTVPSGNLINWGNFSVKSHYVMENVFVGHDDLCWSRFNG